MTNPLLQKLKRLRYLSVASDGLLNELASSGMSKRFDSDEPVYLQNNEPKAAHLIISGMINRESTAEGATVLQHARAYAGDWLGLANITSRHVPYMHSAIAADTSEILSFDALHFMTLRSNTEFERYLLQIIVKEQLSDEERYLNTISSARSYDKLILFLAAEMGRMQTQGVSTIHAPYIIGTQEYFAHAIGIKRETVSRDLQPLIAARIIERTYGVRPTRYTILKQGNLSALASSPLLRSAMYEKARRSKIHRRFSDVA
jgi:CRP-like cAMP-binding protein